MSGWCRRPAAAVGGPAGFPFTCPGPPTHPSEAPRGRPLRQQEVSRMRQVRLLAGAAALGAAVLFFGASTARPANPPGWGTIKGQVVWGGGSAPERPKLKVDKD